MEKLLNIKCNWKHSTLEYLIKKFDASQDMSRAAVFEREVKAAENVGDWKDIRVLLSELNKIDDAPTFTNIQAKYGTETDEVLKEVRKQMLSDLKVTGLKVLQSQYMVLLLQVNYLEFLKKEKLAIKANEFVEEENVDMPEMSKILCEMMLCEKDCNEIKEIRKILVDWRNKR